MSKLIIVVALAASALIPAGCQRMVEVETGTKVVCTYGEVISDNTTVKQVPANEAANYQVITVLETCDKHSKLRSLYQEAQTAIGAGDLKTAQAKLEQVVATDAAFGQAKTQLEVIKSGKKPSADKSGGEPTGSTGTATKPKPKPGEGDTSVPSGSLLKWAPDELAGYKATKPSIDPLNIAREYIPLGSTPVSFVIVAEQDSTATGAKQALTRQVKQRYPEDSATAEVNGRSTYFGTDGKRFAALGFTDGSVMVALEMSVKPGSDPKALKDELVAAAKLLP